MVASGIHNWVYASLAIIGSDLMLRLARTRVVDAKIVALSDPSEDRGRISQIQIEGVRSGWTAGQHVLVRTAGWRILDGE